MLQRLFFRQGGKGLSGQEDENCYQNSKTETEPPWLFLLDTLPART